LFNRVINELDQAQWVIGIELQDIELEDIGIFAGAAMLGI
jgi:hypothetical protein